MTGPRVTLVVDGCPVTAAPGTSVAAALLNAGTLAFRRSERGEPRSPLCGMGSCFECRVTVDGIAHRRSCLTPVRDGMVVETAEGDGGPPGVATARAGPPGVDHLSRTEPAGSHRLVTADVAVVGAGPAGIAAASRAAEAGRTVVLLDGAPNAGGQIWRHGTGMPPRGAAGRWLDRLRRAGVSLLPGAAVIDATREPPRESHGRGRGASPIRLVAERAGEPIVVHAGALVIATGARERFLPFPGWTLPGVVGIGGVQALLKQGAVVAGKRAVVAGTGPLLLPVAAALSGAGARVLLVAEQAPAARVRRFALSLLGRPETLLQAARYRAAFLASQYETGVWVTAAEGDGRLCAVTVTDGRRARSIACDILATGYGLVPNIELALLMGCEVAAGAVVVGGSQRTSLDGVYAAGEVTGVGGVDLALVEGELAGTASAVAGPPASDPRLVRRRTGLQALARTLEAVFAPRPEVRALGDAETIVCRCEDARRSVIEPHGSSRQAKVHGRAGMGPCQGRVCAPALETCFGWPRDTVRPPLEPATLETLIMCGDDRVEAPPTPPTHG